jgi:hypothetical protein
MNRIGSVGVWHGVVAASLDVGSQTTPTPHPSGPRKSFAEHLRKRPTPRTPAPTLGTFGQRVAALAEGLRIRPDDLLAVMRFESGLRPDAINPTTHAVGLIQFLPRTAADLLGLPPEQPDRERCAVEAFAGMSADQQLDYVEAYFERVLGGRGTSSLRDTYMAVLYPAAVGGGDAYVIARADGNSGIERAVYGQNAPLDTDGDGAITAREAAAQVERLRGGGS